MPLELFTNAATPTTPRATTLAAAMLVGDTTLSVTSSAGFPAAVTGVSQFRALIESEIVLVTNVATTTWTVVRGLEGTAAAAHASGVAVSATVTAGALSNVSPVTAARIRPAASTQSINNGSVVDIIYGTTVFDAGGMTGVTANALVVPAGRAGLWQLSSTINISGNTAGTRNVQIKVNNTIIADAGVNGAANGNRVQVNTAFVLAAGDAISSSIFQDSGVTLTLNSPGPSDTVLVALRVGPTT